MKFSIQTNEDKGDFYQYGANGAKQGIGDVLGHPVLLGHTCSRLDHIMLLRCLGSERKSDVDFA